MRRASIISRYVFRELVSPFAISLVFLTLVFLMTRIPEIINMVVNYNAGISPVTALILFSLPRFMEFTVPMSVMIAVLMTFIRMSGDNEIIALKGGGVSIVRLLTPVMLFSILAAVFCLWITVWGVPWGKLSIKKKGIEIAQTSLAVALKERQFNDTFNNVMIYISSMDIKTKELRDIFIEDSRAAENVVVAVAPRGILVADTVQMVYTLRLYQGIVNQVDLNNRVVNTIGFDTYDINLDLGKKAANISDTLNKDFDEMRLGELIDSIQGLPDNSEPLNEAKMDLHEKFSIPVACIALGLLAMAIGLQAGSSRRSSGFGLGVFFILFYYLLLAAGWSAGETGDYPPEAAMWMPDIVIGGIAVWLFLRIAKERPVSMPLFVQRGIQGIQKRIFFKNRKNG